MKGLLLVLLFFQLFFVSNAQPLQEKAKYPSLFWEISGKGLTRPSYLFGTMHVSNKMVFHLSDSFYIGLKNAQVVALETNPATWQEDFSRYDLEGENGEEGTGRYSARSYGSTTQDYLTVSTFRLTSFEKAMESVLKGNPSLINTYLYRSHSDGESEFEEDTYLDLHIYQAGRKLGKKICGVEDFHGSMQLVKEAYADAAREKKKRHSYEQEETFSYARMEEAYRTGNLDLLDTINKVNSRSAAFDEKFLYQRNKIQSASIDSILKTGASLFVGVGAAHLPGFRGVIELLRKEGYTLRPIKMKDRDSHHKEAIEKIRVAVPFKKQVAEDGFYQVMTPGKLYTSARDEDGVQTAQSADMTNGSYYMVTRLFTNAALLGLTEAQVLRKLDSVIYENIPGKIIRKTAVIKNGYTGLAIVNRTRRGDYQRYQIFVTPFEIVQFKMSGNGDYVNLGSEAQQFFSSIQISNLKPDWKTWQPASGGFEALFPHKPILLNGRTNRYASFDKTSQTAVEVIRTSLHNFDFLEEDSFDLTLMEESFASSERIDTCLMRRWTQTGGFKSLDASYRFRDSTIALVRFLVQGPQYYTVIATARHQNPHMQAFIRSFAIKPFVYGSGLPQVDSNLHFKVTSPVALNKKRKLAMYPENAFYPEWSAGDDSLINNGTFKSRMLEDETTGEKIYVSYYKHSPYYYREDGLEETDSVAFRKEWIIRQQSFDTLTSGLVVHTYSLGNQFSSRMLRGKEIGKDGMGYKILSMSDTLSAPSDFVAGFFNSFQPTDDFKEIDVTRKKTDLFFSQFFSSDTLEHKRAVKNIAAVKMDTQSFRSLQQLIAHLNWNEKDYLDVKKEAIAKIAFMPSAETADYLLTLYKNSGDTLELQYSVVKALLCQKTKYAYGVFAGIMQTDPPVLIEKGSDLGREENYADAEWENEEWFRERSANEMFLNNLTDSLELTAGIFKDLLPLINVEDYEDPLLSVMGMLVDSGLLLPADYEIFLPKFILEAQQMLKKQVIRAKNLAIQKRKTASEEKEIDKELQVDDGASSNSKLHLYATLLRPFYRQNRQVAAVLHRLLESSDNNLKFKTALLFERHNMPVENMVWLTLASQDVYRYALYTNLKKMGKEGVFPPSQKNTLAMARSQLIALQLYAKPDTLVFVDTYPLSYNGYDGMLYLFKYKENGEETFWKLASAGLYPTDSSHHFSFAGDSEDEWPHFMELSATRLTGDKPVKEQLETFVKKLVYSRRKSSSQFYAERDNYDFFEFGR